MVRYADAVRQAPVHHGLGSVPALRRPEDGIGGRYVSPAPSASADPPIRDSCVAPQDRRGIEVDELIVPFRTALGQVGGARRAGKDMGDQGRQRQC